MCGIAGYFTWDPECRNILPGCLPGALSALHHRGPDDCGSWRSDDGIGLAHTRLSILDLTEHGHQPMHSADGRWVMVFNGEIYNFADLRRELAARGHSFEGTGDSEVILAAITEWGIEAAVRRFIGMFAIALWDRADKELTLVRDRLGVKPLYFGWDGKTLWFGSELKALRTFSHWQPTIDRDALADYFRFGYITAPRSIYSQVHKLMPGHTLRLKAAGEPAVRKYWSVLDAMDTPAPSDEEEAADQLEALMVDAFRLRMVADVPVGIFLSGGLDSSLVAALLQKHHGNIHTFTIGFDESTHDEAPHARRIAERLGTVHTEQILRTGEAAQILLKWADLYDEPFSDSSGIPTYLVSQLASKQVKVVLSADGGDELFAGYSVYADIVRKNRLRQSLPSWLRGFLGHRFHAAALDVLGDAILASPLPEGLRGSAHRKIARRSARMLEYVAAPSSGAVYRRGISHWSDRELAGLLGTGTRLREDCDSYRGGLLDQMCLWDLHNYLPGDILAKVDRATMALSIESREPLLDHRIVEFAFRLPAELKQGKLGTKHLLRKVLYRHVPRELVERPKQGFGIPLGRWLWGDLAAHVDRYLSPDRIKSENTLDPSAVNRVVRRFRRGDLLAANQLWSLLAFEMWRERWN